MHHFTLNDIHIKQVNPICVVPLLANSHIAFRVPLYVAFLSHQHLGL